MVKRKMYFEIEVEELLQEKQELEQEFFAFTKECSYLFEHIKTLNSMWEYYDKKEVYKKAERACNRMEEQAEEMKQLIECMNHAVRQYRTMEEQAKRYVKCVAWES